MAKIIIVDDKEMFRTTLKSFLEGCPETKVIGTAANGLIAIDLIKTGTIPEVVLLDIEMPVLNGLRTLIELRKFNIDIRVIILSMYCDAQLIEEFKKHGANGYVTKNNTTEILLEAIHKVINGDEYFEFIVERENNLRDSKIRSLKLQYNISEREFEIMFYVCKGLRDKEISDILCIAERTVETHKTNVFKKVGVSSNMELILFAINKGLVTKNINRRDL